MPSRPAGDQLSLRLHAAPARGDHACGARVAELLAEGIRCSGKSRERVAAEMSDLLEVRVTVAMLNAWSAPSKPQHRLPAEYLGAFCHAVGSSALLELLAEQAGVHVVGPAARAQLEVLDLDERLRALRKHKRELMALAERWRTR